MFYPTLPLRGHYALPLLLTITVGDITFGRRMGQNKTLSIIENVRQNINSVIPIRTYVSRKDPLKWYYDENRLFPILKCIEAWLFIVI